MTDMPEQPDIDVRALQRSIRGKGSTFPRNTAELAREIDEAIERYGLKPEIIVANNPGMGRFLQRIIAEREQQDKKWGQQDHDPVEWISILVEEVGEAAEQANKLHWPHADKRVAWEINQFIIELVQVAAVATACYESLRRNEIAELEDKSE